MAANEGKILPLPPQAAMTEAPHIAVESPGEGKLRQIGFAQAVDDVVSLRGADYAETILPDQTGHAGMVLQTDGTTADWANVETVRLYAKNNSGSTLVRGQAVYVNGASGTNILITKAQANAEPTSSKTIGLVETASVAPNEFCWVVTEGILAGVDTSAFSDGNALWLSPTTLGGITATKPSAPNHMVFIGYVIWSQINNGEIYVKPQNGFELEELHNVQISSPTTGQALVYDATVTPPLWKNATISGGGGGTVAVGDITGMGTGVSTFLATPTSANLKAAVTDETGSAGKLVFADTTTAPTANSVLKWDGSSWVPGSLTNTNEFTFLVSSFYVGLSGLQEIGTGVWKAAGALSFTVSYNYSAGISGASIQISGTGVTVWASALALSSPYTSGTSALATNYPTTSSTSYRSITFTVTATNGVTSPTATNTITFANRRYWGVSTKTSGYTATDVTSLSGTGSGELTIGSSKASFTVTANTGYYIVYATPSKLGTVSFTDNTTGFAFSMAAYETVSITNSSGFTENYYVYRSTYPGLGYNDIKVS
jgi:hypothetical protein